MKFAMPPRLALPAILAALTSAFAPASASASPQEPSQAATVVIVRHAETADDGTRDPSLSADGLARAAALAESLAAADVAAVYSTQYRRTRETGGVVAERTGAPLVVVPIDGDVATHADALIERIVAEHAGRTVLVVGHSNTVPVLVHAATGVDVEPIPEHEHGRMYVVRTDGERRSVVVAGIPDGVGAAEPGTAPAAGTPPDAGTPPASGPPPACEAAAHRAFDFWVGRWSVRAPDGRSAGRSRVTRVSDGCAVLEEWSGAGGQTGTSLNFYDDAAGEWVQVWAGGGGEILRLHGGLVDGAMVMDGAGPRETPQGVVLDRIRWTPKEDGSVFQEWLISSDDGASWSTLFAGVYRPAG